MASSLKDAIIGGIPDQLRINRAALQHANRSYRPVYKIAITYPKKSIGVTVTKIIADTTRDKPRFFGLPVSDLIGLWVDQDDVGQPDKAVLLFRVDPTYTKEIIIGKNDIGNAISDKDLAFNRYLTGRYWLDIWVGYKDTFTGELLPENLDYWHSDAHLFSGPIEVINRKIGISGDMLQIVALSSERVLQFATFRTTNKNEELTEDSTQGKNDKTGTSNTIVINNISEGNTEKITYALALFTLFDSLMPEREWKLRKKSDNPPDFAFVIGNFYWSLIQESIMRIKILLKNGGVDNARKGYLPILDKWITSKLFDGSVTMQTQLSVSKKADFWSVIQTMVRPEYNGNIGCGFQVLKVSNFPKPDGGPKLSEGISYYFSDIDEGDPFISTSVVSLPRNRNFKLNTKKISDIGDKKSVEKYGGHGGVHFQFFIPIDVDEFLEYYTLQKANENKPKLIHDSQFQKITIGQDIIELDSFIEYSTCYNAFRAILKSPIKSQDLPPFWEEIPKTMLFPNDFIDNPNGDILKEIREGDLKKYDKPIFWQDVINDIETFGIREFPIEKWFAVGSETIVDWTDRLAVDESIRKDLVASLPMKAIAGHEGATEVFKRMYFAGLEGSAMIVGSPLIRPGKYIQIRDIRDAYTRSGSFVPETTEQIKEFTRNVTQKLMGFTTTGLEPDRVNTNFQNPIGQSYFVWKTRHYLGAKSGYISKCYFMKQRSRTWRKTGDTVGEMIKSAMRESREIFGGG